MENLIGKKVKVNITKPEGYTSDLYNAIQGEIGEVIEQNSNKIYKDGWLVKFGKSALNKYKKTHSGKWSHAHRMEWWTEREYLQLI